MKAGFYCCAERAVQVRPRLLYSEMGGWRLSARSLWCDVKSEYVVPWRVILHQVYVVDSGLIVYEWVSGVAYGMALHRVWI